MNFLIKDDKMLNKYNEVWEKILGLKFEVLGLICPRLVHVQLLLQKKPIWFSWNLCWSKRFANLRTKSTDAICNNIINIALRCRRQNIVFLHINYYLEHLNWFPTRKATGSKSLRLNCGNVSASFSRVLTSNLIQS